MGGDDGCPSSSITAGDTPLGALMARYDSSSSDESDDRSARPASATLSSSPNPARFVVSSKEVEEEDDDDEDEDEDDTVIDGTTNVGRRCVWVIDDGMAMRARD